VLDVVLAHLHVSGEGGDGLALAVGVAHLLLVDLLAVDRGSRCG
jgi:hypothetical protein